MNKHTGWPLGNNFNLELPLTSEDLAIWESLLPSRNDWSMFLPYIRGDMRDAQIMLQLRDTFDKLGKPFSKEASMDPSQILADLVTAIAQKNYSQAVMLLTAYYQWRLRGGSEPHRGDLRAALWSAHLEEQLEKGISRD